MASFSPKDPPAPLGAAASHEPSAPTATASSSVTAHAAATRDVRASSVADEAKTPACPHCGSPLIDHKATEGPKAGAWHCDNCGGCWVHRGSAWFSRDGHPAPDAWTKG